MWWGELYLALTLLTAGYVVWKGDAPLLRAMLFVAAQYVIYNYLHDTVRIWFPLTNQITDVLILFFLYANWYNTKARIFAVLCFVFVGRALWHVWSAMFQVDPYSYAAGNNALFVLELLALWIYTFNAPTKPRS